MKKAYDNRINLESSSTAYHTKELTNPFLFVKRVHILYPLQKTMVMYLTLLVLRNVASRVPSFTLIPEEDIIRYLDLFFKQHTEELMSEPNTWYRNTFDISVILIDIFSNSGVVLCSETVRGGKDQSNITYWLQHKLENTIPFSQHLPRITPPKRIDTKENLKYLVAPYYKGELTISPSNQIIDSLNLSQKKGFRTILISNADPQKI